MNFTELYQRIRSIDEAAPSEPTAPGGVIKTKNADGSVSYKPKVPGERLTSTLPANQAAKTTDTSDKDKAKAVNEECGDMPVGMMGMSSPQGQQDSVTMNISMNGSGAGGIRDLMSILRNIESSDNADVHSHDVSKLFGGDDIEVAFDEEMSDGGFGAASTMPDPTVSGIDAVTATGNDLASKGIEAPKVNGGGNPMHEALASRLYQMYQEIKEQKTTEAAKWRDPKHKDKLYTQEPDDGEGDHYDYYRDSRPDNDPGQKHSTFNRNKDTDKLHYPYGDYEVGQKAQVGDRAKKGLLTKNSIRVVKNRIKGTSGDHPTPNLPK